MFVTNPSIDAFEFYRRTVDNLTTDVCYEFSVYVANILIPLGYTPSSILLEARITQYLSIIISYTDSGAIQESSMMS